ncbi:MAG: hypothetical protein WCY34_00620 [Candidatus Omnitrophota bacterium]
MIKFNPLREPSGIHVLSYRGTRKTAGVDSQRDKAIKEISD